MPETGSVWICCEDCGGKTRSLAVMSKRVLAERRSCPDCGSQRDPVLEATPSGAHIPSPSHFGSSVQAERALGGYRDRRPGSWIHHALSMFKGKTSLR